jgi:hypothetical protein
MMDNLVTWISFMRRLLIAWVSKGPFQELRLSRTSRRQLPPPVDDVGDIARG